MDHIQESAKKKRKRRSRMFCTICQKFNHNTESCWKNSNEMRENNEDGLDVLAEEKPTFGGDEGKA